MGLFQLKKSEQELPQAEQSRLTGKQACLQRIDQVLEHASAKNKGAVLKLYLEGFKNLNDTFGYEFGEELLAEITSYLAEESEGEVFRYIGVEFVIVMEQGTYGKAVDLAGLLIDRFGSAWKIGDTECLCPVHIGVTLCHERAENATQLIKMLDMAVNESVEVGPNTYVVYDEKLYGKDQRRKAIAVALREAIDQDLFEFNYRPTYCTTAGQYTRAEAYYRLFVGNLGLVPAAEIVPIAEDSGQVVAFQYYAIEKVCMFIKELLDAGKLFESIAVPISGVMFFQTDFAERVEEFLKKYDIPPKRLAIEVTESVLTAAYLNANISMQELSDVGVEIVLNNFGTGYSGISSILDLPVDVLKLERTFVWQLEISEMSGVVIEGLIKIAHNLNLKIIAEGVETENQLKKLTEYGCAYRQGFYYSPTVSKEKLLEMLENAVVVRE